MQLSKTTALSGLNVRLVACLSRTSASEALSRPVSLCLGVSLAACALMSSLFLAAQAQNQYEYPPQFQPQGNRPDYQYSGPGYPVAPPQGAPGQPYYPQPAYAEQSAPAVIPAKAGAQQAKVAQWFQQYDDIRRKAQMNPTEKQQADTILGKGLAILMPGPDKLAAKEILSKLVTRYDYASKSLQNLQPIQETSRLQQNYFQYFSNARALFSDYLRVQDNLMAKDASGQPLMSSLMQRKLALEQLEHGCKELDGQTRAAFGIAAYQYY